MFANSWAILIGLTAAALPLVVHWLTRPKPVRLSVSTLRFIRGAVEQRRARYRLRDLLVLLFRVAAILLLAFAIARPLEFSGGLVTRSTSEGLPDDVRAALNDQSAFLTVTSVG